MHIIWQKNARVLYQKTSVYGSVCPGSATETHNGNCSCGTRNWATPQGDSKTHHHFGVHVFQTCKIGELRSHRFESRQGFRNSVKPQSVWRCVILYMSSQVGSMNLGRQNLSFSGGPRMLKVPNCPLKKAGDTERTWTKREATFAADSCTEGMKSRSTPLQSWTMELQGLGFVPLGFSLTLVSSCYAISSFFLFWNGDIQIRVVGSMYFFIYSVTHLRECLKSHKRICTMDFWTVFKP